MIDITEKIKIAEGNMVGCFWINPQLYSEVEIKESQLSYDGIFYYGLGKALYKAGNDVFDEASIYNYMLGHDKMSNAWIKNGEYKTIKEWTRKINIDNFYGYLDTWRKYKYLESISKKGFNIEIEWNKFECMTAEEIYDYLEYQLVSENMELMGDLDVENLGLTDEELDEIEAGVNIGLQYGKYSPILNYLTLGIPKSDLTMISSYTNGGKSSFIMSNIIIPLAEQGHQGVIVSNEQKSIVYKLLLLIYVLTRKLNYYKVTRKKLKTGKWSDEDKKMILMAKKIIKEEYSEYINFVKMYDYDMGKVKKIVKKLSKRGCEYLIYDTMKYSGDDDSVWQSLLADSKDLFQICSKENIAGVVTFQLALHTKGKLRWIDEGALSNGKQVAEVFSEMAGFRDIWDDEFADEPCDIKPYQYKKDSAGNFTSVKEFITLDKNKRYKLFFLFKTRNDSNDQCLLYEFDGNYNIWREIGYCTPHHKNRY